MVQKTFKNLCKISGMLYSNLNWSARFQWIWRCNGPRQAAEYTAIDAMKASFDLEPLLVEFLQKKIPEWFSMAQKKGDFLKTFISFLVDVRCEAAVDK